MRIHQVQILRFRGIKQLDWKPGGPMVCLIGPGDSGKSTILDAIEAALSSRWNLGLTDDDFFNGDTSHPIVVAVTVGGLPTSLMSDERYGHDLRGWSPDDELHDEPEDDDEAVLTVQLTVDSSLEPQWVVKTDRNGDGRSFPTRDRELLGVARIGNDPERHLRWAKGSALSRLTGGMSEVNAVLATAARQARGSLRAGQLPALEAAAQQATEAMRGFGVQVRQQLVPALGIETFSSSSSALMLHDGAVPVHAAGMGSRRLSALALQSAAVRAGAILLVDEIEHGLEPHRVRNLVSRLDKKAGQPDGFGQVIATTHSPIALVELSVDRLRVVRTTVGTISVQKPTADLQANVRTTPDALLARKVLVTEGKTEVGVLRALDRHWEETRGAPLAHHGVAVVNGDGNLKCLKVALGLLRLGYPVCVLADDDVPLPAADLAEVTRLGGKVILWGSGLAIEDQIAADAPIAALQEILTYGGTQFGHAEALGAVKGKLGAHSARVTGPDIAAWVAAGVPEALARKALGGASKESFKGWFKRTDHGEWLGSLLARVLPQIPGSPLAQRLADAESWCHAA